MKSGEDITKKDESVTKILRNLNKVPATGARSGRFETDQPKEQLRNSGETRERSIWVEEQGKKGKSTEKRGKNFSQRIIRGEFLI